MWNIQSSEQKHQNDIVLLKQLLKTQNKRSKELGIMYKMQSISVFLDITKVADFQWKNADVSRTQGVNYVIYVFWGSFADKV